MIVEIKNTIKKIKVAIKKYKTPNLTDKGHTGNKTINKIPNEVLDKEQKIIEDNDLIIFIKNSLDDNLKNFFDFSYKSFLNEESEREV